MTRTCRTVRRVRSRRRRGRVTVCQSGHSFQVLGPESKSRARFSSSLCTFFAGFLKNWGTGGSKNLFHIVGFGTIKLCLPNFTFNTSIVLLDLKY